MKIRTFIGLALAAALVLVPLSCNKQAAVSAPTIELEEVGEDNSHSVVRGEDLHLEAEILAEGLVQSIIVKIVQKNGSTTLTSGYTSGKYIGVKNVEFHEHIVIPMTAPTGAYYLYFQVTDQKGQSTTAEDTILVTEHEVSEYTNE